MRREPRATYRLQLTPGFRFADAAALADYLAALGVSHAYLSPSFEAEPGSTHGYDVVDPGRVREELGGAAGWAQMNEALEARGLGRMLDIVPNHMSIASTANFWWWDVLENGLSSKYAAYFDVDWAPQSSPSENRILLPILSERYGAALTGGRLSLERRGGSFGVRVGDRVLPAAPRALDDVLRRAAYRAGSDELAFYADAVHGLPLSTSTDRESLHRRHRDKGVIGVLLARLFETEPRLAAAVDATIAEINADPVALDAFLERQNWRVTHWANAASELGYRRFFDVHTLVGLRVEDDWVMEDTHRLVIGWLTDGTLDGVRVDHPDGLRDPAGYLVRLRRALPDAWIVIEKILAPDEPLPAAFPVDGTSGYDFLRLVGGLFVDPAGAAPLGELAERVTGEAQDFAVLAREGKRQVLREQLGSELSRVVDLALRVVGGLPEGRDFFRQDLARALTEILISFPVYRTYVHAGAKPELRDRVILAAAVAEATARRPDLTLLFELLLPILTLDRADGGDLIERLQQIAAAVTAKGVEDTAFYRHLRLLALNEVGGDPERFGESVEAFHRAMADAPRRSMLATATHDTKRGEDVRMRLAVLSELPDEWAAAVERLSALRPDAPDPHAAYFFYQTVVGAWPLDPDRAWAYLEKSAREAKRRTSWTRPDAAYEEALRGFVTGALSDPAFRAEVERFLARILPAAQRNSLGQTLIKLTAPGVGDIYQGTELWDLSLVDPDNRRPVDFDTRRRLLAELDGAEREAILARMDEGLPKLWVIRQALRLRARRPEAFAGAYRPLEVEGPQASHVVAFARGGDEVAVAVPRLTARLEQHPVATLTLPPGVWRNELTGDMVAGGPVSAGTLWDRFPVTLLSRES